MSRTLDQIFGAEVLTKVDACVNGSDTASVNHMVIQMNELFRSLLVSMDDAKQEYERLAADPKADGRARSAASKTVLERLEEARRFREKASQVASWMTGEAPAPRSAKKRN